MMTRKHMLRFFQTYFSEHLLDDFQATSLTEPGAAQDQIQCVFVFNMMDDSRGNDFLVNNIITFPPSTYL